MDKPTHTTSQSTSPQPRRGLRVIRVGASFCRIVDERRRPQPQPQRIEQSEFSGGR
jgi:hypothetical protein